MRPDPEDLLARGFKNSHSNTEIKLLWMSIGKDDDLLKDAEKFRAVLRKHGYHLQWSVTEGRHEWTVWRQYLRDFAPLVFRKEDLSAPSGGGGKKPPSGG